MNKQYVFILAAIVAVSQYAGAQSAAIEEGATTASATGGSTNGPIVIVNKYSGSQDTRQDSRQDARVEGRQGALAGSSTTAVQEQPLTVIESTPLRESRAEQIRRARLSVEAQTESKIVEKLESARIEDERARQERVLGAVGGAGQAPQQQAPAAQPAPQPVVVPAPQPAPAPIVIQQPAVQVVPVVVKPQRAEVIEVEERGELKSTFHDESYAKPQEQRYFIAGNLGVMEYANKSNIQGNGSGGFTVGTLLPDNLIAEGTFLYSTYTVDVLQPSLVALLPPVVRLQQYNFMGALKYQFPIGGRIRPFGGALASYAYRRYQDKFGSGYYYSYDASTNAFDVGLVAGLDVEITRKFSVGADLRYLTNVATSEPGVSRSFYPVSNGNSVEKSDYYSFQIVGKFMF